MFCVLYLVSEFALHGREINSVRVPRIGTLHRARIVHRGALYPDYHNAVRQQYKASQQELQQQEQGLDLLKIRSIFGENSETLRIFRGFTVDSRFVRTKWLPSLEPLPTAVVRVVDRAAWHSHVMFLVTSKSPYPTVLFLLG